jgi:hypothetical protein
MFCLRWNLPGCHFAILSHQKPVGGSLSHVMPCYLCGVQTRMKHHWLPRQEIVLLCYGDTCIALEKNYRMFGLRFWCVF